MTTDPNFDQHFAAETETPPRHTFLTDSIHVARRIWRFMSTGWESQPQLIMGPRAGREIRLIQISGPITALTAAGITDQAAGVTSVVWLARPTITCLARRSGRFVKLFDVPVAG